MNVKKQREKGREKEREREMRTKKKKGLEMVSAEPPAAFG